MNHEMIDNLDQQLQMLYAERELLADELGCHDAEDVVNMVRNLESQLNDLYQTHGHHVPLSNSGTMQLLQCVQELSQTLDGLYSEKTVTFELDGDKPVLKASWKETLNQGDAQ